MKLAGRIPVAPLDDERLINIERRVVAGAPDAAARGRRFAASRRIAGRALVVVAMVAAGVVGWTLHAPARGPVAFEPAPIRVEGAPRGAVLDLGDARIESGPDAAFAVTRPAGGVLVAMTRGKVELEVGKRSGRPPLIVRAGDTDVIVVGTHFTVDAGDGHGDVDVQVTEGVVRVVHQQQETRVAAGQAWRTRAGRVVIAERQAAPASAAPGAPTVASAAPTVATAPTAPTAPIVIGDAPAVLHDRKAAVPEPRVMPAPIAPATLAPPRGPAATRARPTVAPGDPRVDLRAAIRAQRLAPALALGEPSAASAIARYYDIAAHKSGEEASQAFYSIAVVRHLRLARNAEALQTLDAYVRRFPGGKEYRAALWLRVRILCLDKIDDRCRAAAYTFVHEAPDDPAARVAELLTLSE